MDNEQTDVTHTAEQTMGNFARSIADENERLTEDLLLLEDVLVFHGTEERMSVELFIYVLTDKEGVTKFMESLDPESAVRDNYPAVIQIVTSLRHWRELGVIYQRDTIAQATTALVSRGLKNMQLLGNFS